MEQASSERPRRPVNLRAKLIGLVLGILLTPVALVLAIASAGAGHGDYGWARWLYPFTMLGAVVTGTISYFGVAVACVQFPVYGWLFGAAWRWEIQPRKVALIAVGAHALALGLVYVYPYW